MTFNEYKIHYTEKNNPSVTHTTFFKTWQNDVEYAWRTSPANIPHTNVVKVEKIG